MATRRKVVEDEEFEHLQRGSGARAAARRRQIAASETDAISAFFKNHPEITNCTANETMLLREADSYGGIITAPMLELALHRVAAKLAFAPPPAPQPTATEIAAEERKRLLGLTLPELRDEIRKKNLKKRIPSDVLSPEIAALKTKEDIHKLSASEMRRLLYRGGDGSIRQLNKTHVENILNGF